MPHNGLQQWKVAPVARRYRADITNNSERSQNTLQRRCDLGRVMYSRLINIVVSSSTFPRDMQNHWRNSPKTIAAWEIVRYFASQPGTCEIPVPTWLLNILLAKYAIFLMLPSVALPLPPHTFNRKFTRFIVIFKCPRINRIKIKCILEREISTKVHPYKVKIGGEFRILLKPR